MKTMKYTHDLVARTNGDAYWNRCLTLLASLPPVAPHGPWLCGGAIRRMIQGDDTTSDFDYFFASQEQQQEFEKTLSQVAAVTRETPFNKTWSFQGRLLQQITLRTYQSIDDVLDSFDFTICQFAWDGESITCGPYALYDLARKRLAIHRLTYGVSTMRRLMKYSRQGFTICGGILADILQRTLDNPSTINADVVSID